MAARGAVRYPSESAHSTVAAPQVLPKEKGGLLGKELPLFWEGCLGKSCHFLILGGLLGKELPLVCAGAVGMELAFAHSVVLLPGASQADQST